MKDFGFWLFVLALSVVSCLLIFAYVYDYITPDDYTYIDFAGNKGTADFCSNRRRGLICYKGDKRIAVREFMIIGGEE